MNYLDAIIQFMQNVDLTALVWRYYVNEFESQWEMECAHTHKAFEIISIVSGTGNMWFGSNCERVKKDNCLMILPHTPHRFCVDKDCKCTLVNIHFNCDHTPLEDFFKKNNDESNSLQSGILENGYLKVNNSRAIADAMKAIVSELENKEKEHQTIVKLLFAELFIHITRILCEGKQGDCSKKVYMKEAKQYIEHNLAEPLTPQSISKSLHISSGYLMHIFKDFNGLTIMDFVLLRRLEKSKILLYETNEKITTIASKVGIPNSQYFSVLFKKCTGMTPREYRQALRMKNISDSNIFK